MKRLKALGIGAALGGATAYVVSRSERSGRAIGGRIYGMVPRPRGRVDDVTLAQQVQSELFRSDHEAKGSVSVNAADGVVQLRGEIGSPELIEELVDRARRVRGVRDVENLLHVPGADAPMHQ